MPEQILRKAPSSHGYGQITHHIVLVPKYRYTIFYNRRAKMDCEFILRNICNEQGYRIHALEIVADQGDLGNEDSTISGFHKTGRESVRPEAYSIL
jgi:hypothetical protein